MLTEEQNKKRTKMWVWNADLYVRRRCGPLYLCNGGYTGREMRNHSISAYLAEEKYEIRWDQVFASESPSTAAPKPAFVSNLEDIQNFCTLEADTRYGHSARVFVRKDRRSIMMRAVGRRTPSSPTAQRCSVVLVTRHCDCTCS